MTSTSQTSKKKSVSFKATLETSDDKNIVKKVYNPDNAPLVPIIKRKLNGLGKTTCIVRPSRLTDVLKNNESSSLIKSSLFSSVSVQNIDGDRSSGLSIRHESPRKSLHSFRIIKSNKQIKLGYPREFLKKLRKSIDGKTSLSKLNQYLNETGDATDDTSCKCQFCFYDPYNCLHTYPIVLQHNITPQHFF